MRAVVEAALLGRLVELREVVAQRFAVETPQPEFADARRIDDVRTAAEVVKGGRSGRVASRAALRLQPACRDLQALVERVQDG